MLLSRCNGHVVFGGSFWEMLTIDLFSRLVTLKQVAKKVVKVLNVSFAPSPCGLLGHP